MPIIIYISYLKMDARIIVPYIFASFYGTRHQEWRGSLF